MGYLTKTPTIEQVKDMYNENLIIGSIVDEINQKDIAIQQVKILRNEAKIELDFDLLLKSLNNDKKLLEQSL